MEPQAALTLGQNALFLLLAVAAPVLATVLGVGLVISLFQAITQIHEQTLSFVPKLIVVAVSILIFGGLIVGLLSDFMVSMFERIPDLVK